VRPGKLGKLGVRLPPFERFQERFGERSAQAERLADRAHLGPEPRVGVRKLLEVEARRLHCDVVERGLEGGGRLAGDVVWKLLERVPDRE
jgi:hypothetical protein